MKISDQRKFSLYQAIAEPITEARIKVFRHKLDMFHFKVDDLLYELTEEIYKNVKKSLNIKGDD